MLVVAERGKWNPVCISRISLFQDIPESESREKEHSKGCEPSADMVSIIGRHRILIFLVENRYLKEKSATLIIKLKNQCHKTFGSPLFETKQAANLAQAFVL